MSLEITSSAISDRGSREYNEDAYANEDLMAGRCVIVADGAGGHRGGDVASRLTVDTVLRSLGSAQVWSEGVLVAAIDAAGAAVRQHRDDQQMRSDMASTVAILCIDAKANAARWAHLGDTRILYFRSGMPKLLTRDHSIRQSFVDASLVPSDSRETGPNRSALYAAVGAEGDTRPRVGECPTLEDGDAFLVCSDGVWDTLDEGRIAGLLGRAHSAQQWLQSIATAVREESKAQQDNFTAVGLWIGFDVRTPDIRRPK
jgi:serine/threonine protein phosphatase PrpC